MKNWWDILGIDKDADLRAIKRAYAAKLKTIRQDENPAEFMELRDAYSLAILFVNGQYKNQYAATTTQWSATSGNLPVVQGVEENENNNALAVLEEAKILLQSSDTQTDQAAWGLIFEDPRIESIDDFTQFEAYFIEHLLLTTNYEENRHIHDYLSRLKSYNFPVLRPPVSNFIFKRLGWDNNNYARQYTQEIEWLTHQFGVGIEDLEEDYWYFAKRALDKSVLWIEVDETDIHPGLLVLGTVAFLIVFGVFFSTIMKAML